jgi:hypothetical protein
MGLGRPVGFTNGIRRELLLVIAGVRGEQELLNWLSRYRAQLKRSTWAARPYVVQAAAID